MFSVQPKTKGSGDADSGPVHLLYLVKVLVAAGIFACLFYFSNTEALGAALRRANYFSVAAGTMIFLYGQYLASLRWRGVLGSGSISVSRFEALGLNLIGTFIGNFLPGQGSGDLAKSAFLFGRFPDRRPFLLASVIYDRLLGLSAMLGVAMAGAFILGFERGDWSLANTAAWALILVAIILSAMIYVYRTQLLWQFLGERLNKRVASFFEQLAELMHNRLLFLRSLALSTAFQLSWALSVWMMLRAIQPGVPLIPVLFAAPTAVLVASMPISLGGLGVREGAFSLLMQRFGIDADVATTGALLSLIPLLIASFIGAYLTLSVQRRQGGHASSV